MMPAKVRYVLLHTIGAMVFIFVLNHFILKTELQSAVVWALGLGAIACFMAIQHTKRWGS